MAEETEPAADLFDRWLSHREQSGRPHEAQPETETETEAESETGTQPQPTHRPEPSGPEDAAPAADGRGADPSADDEPVALEPGPPPGASGPDRPTAPVDFEPVIIPSARRKKPEPRLGRRRSRTQPVDGPATGPAPEEVRAEVERVRAEERAAAARRAAEAERLRRAEEERLAAKAKAQAEAQAEAEAARIAEQERAEEERAEQERAEQERLAEEARLEAEARVAAELEAARLADEAAAARRAEEQRLAAEAARLAEEQRASEERLAEQARLDAEARIAAQLEAARQAEAAERPRTGPDAKVDSVSASRDVLAALAEPAPAATPATESVPVPATTAPAASTRAPEQTTPRRTALERPAERHEPTTEPGVSTNVEFTPRTGTRRLVGLLLLLALAATAGASYAAYQERTTSTVGTAAALCVLTLVIWAVRAGSATARLSVRGGQLEVLRGGGRFVFDLASRYTPVEVVGRPGDRGWKVLFLRRSMAPFVVDASMVDPEEFMAVLRQYRPDPPN